MTSHRRTMSPSTTHTLSFSATAVCVALVLGGCGGSSSTGGSPAAAAGAAPAGATSTATSSTAGAASASSSSAPTTEHNAVDVCSTISVAAASAASGRAFTTAAEADLGKGVYSCTYTGDSLHWSITVYQSPSTSTLDTLLTDLGGSGNSTPVTGIGEKAYVSPVGVAAKFGDRYIEVGSPFNDEANEPGYQALAKAAIAALG